MNTVKEIGKFQKFGSKLGLERMNRLTDLLGNPQEGLKYIHVGGTNGKGSVSTYIYSVLLENDYNVGLFNSPFMDGFRQAILVNDVPMTEDELDSSYAKIDKAIIQMKEDGFESPTEFEVITALALLYYSSKDLDFVILEVGLGGIGDSTNVIGKPLLSVITSVALDHCDVLGNTIEEIALEKAGIIKEGIPVISNVDGEAAKVIAREAYKKSSPLTDVKKIKPTGVRSHVEGSNFSVKIDGINYPDMAISMAGLHQVDNAVCALTVIEYLRRKSLISLDAEATRRGLKKSGLAGRFEIMGENPVLIMDGAHNEQGAAVLAESMEKFFPGKKVLTVMSLMKDKDSNSVIKEFVKFSKDFVVADILKDKKIDTLDMAKTIEKLGGSVHFTAEDKDQLLKVLGENRTNYDIILITGSLYLIREIRGDITGFVR